MAVILPRGYGSAELDPPSDALGAQQERQYDRFIHGDYFKRRCAALLKEARQLNDEVKDATAVYAHPDDEEPALTVHGNDQLEDVISWLQELAGDAPEPASNARAWA